MKNLLRMWTFLVNSLLLLLLYIKYAFRKITKSQIELNFASSEYAQI